MEARNKLKEEINNCCVRFISNDEIDKLYFLTTDVAVKYSSWIDGECDETGCLDDKYTGMDDNALFNHFILNIYKP